MSKPSPTSPAPPATKVRYTVVAVTALMAVLLYLDRFCISMVETYIGEDLGLSPQQIGPMLGAFFWTYALLQVPSGWLTDRFGARTMLTLYILGWSLFTGLTGLAFGLTSLLILRLLVGAAQAGAYPSGAAVISKWVPFRSRGAASGIVSVGGRIGGFLAFILTGPLLVLLAPITVSSRLGPGDLLDTPQLAARLVQSSQPPSEEDASKTEPKPKPDVVLLPRQSAVSLLDGFDSPTRSELERLAAKYIAREKGIEARKKQGDKSPQPPPIKAPRELNVALAETLDARISERDLFPSAAIPEKTPLWNALEAEGKKLLARFRGQLNDNEVERLNRLVLEAASPGAFRKVYGGGWRSVMWIYGALGLAVAGLYWYATRAEPEQHPRVNRQEIELIHAGRPPEASKSSGRGGRVPLVELLSSPSIWLISISQAFTNVGWVFIVTWAPRYFQTVHRVPVETRAVMLAIITAVGWIGMLSGGWLTDALTRRVGLRWGRALPLGLSRFLAAAAYVFCLLNPSPWTAVAALAVVSFGTDLGTAATWAFNQDVGGRNVASVLGWGNMCGNLGAAFLPSLLPFVINMDSPDWNVAFMICGGAFIVSGVCGLGINASKPIVKSEDDKPSPQDPLEEKPFGGEPSDRQE
ncbi:MAG: MFS transporter [Pirellulaceae bacterium]